MVTLVEDNDHAPQMIHSEDIYIFPNTLSSLFAKNDPLPDPQTVSKNPFNRDRGISVCATGVVWAGRVRFARDERVHMIGIQMDTHSVRVRPGAKVLYSEKAVHP